MNQIPLLPEWKVSCCFREHEVSIPDSNNSVSQCDLPFVFRMHDTLVLTQNHIVGLCCSHSIHIVVSIVIFRTKGLGSEECRHCNNTSTETRERRRLLARTCVNTSKLHQCCKHKR